MPNPDSLAGSTSGSRLLKVAMALVAWVAAAGALGLRYADSRSQPGFDFYQFWVGGDVVRLHVRQGRSEPLDFYSRGALSRIGLQYANGSKSPRQGEAARQRVVLDSASSPFFYTVFAAVISGNYERDFDVYILTALLSFAGAIVAFGVRMKFSAAAIGAAVAIAASSSSSICDALVVNIAGPQLALMFLYLALRDRGRTAGGRAAVRFIFAGVLMGAFVAFKPNLILVPVLLNVRELFMHRYRNVLNEAVGAAIGLAAAIGISSWCFGGIDCWAVWAKFVHPLIWQAAMPSEYGNFSLPRALFEWTGHNLILPLMVLGVGIAIATLWLGSRRSGQSKGTVDVRAEFRHDVVVYGLAAVIGFLTSGLAWVHYPKLLSPTFLLAAIPARHTRLSATGGWIRGVLLTAIIALLLYPPPAEIMRFLGLHVVFTSATWNHCAQGALLLALGLFVWMETIWFGRGSAAGAGSGAVESSTVFGANRIERAP